jgi:hypothetical protein
LPLFLSEVFVFEPTNEESDNTPSVVALAF